MTAVIILFVAGVALLFSEFFVPGAVLGITGGILVLASIVVGWQKYPEYGLFILTGELVGVGIVLGLGLFALAKTPLGRGFVLKTNQDLAEGFASPAQSIDLVGTIATVHTALRPAGSILVNKRRIDAVSKGLFIDAGKSVRVVHVEGHRVVCEEVPVVEEQRAS